jgi:hypothetical protein
MMSRSIPLSTGNDIQTKNRNEAILSARCIMPVTPPSIASAMHQYISKGPHLAHVPSSVQTPATTRRVHRSSRESYQQSSGVGQEISSLPPFTFGALMTKTIHPKPNSPVAAQIVNSIIAFTRRHTRFPNLVIHLSRKVLVITPVKGLSKNYRRVQECK